MRNLLFQVRLTADERKLIERLAAHLERRPSDAVRFVIRQAARQIETAQPDSITNERTVQHAR